MILSDNELRQAIRDGMMPLSSIKNVQPASIDMTLGTSFIEEHGPAQRIHICRGDVSEHFAEVTTNEYTLRPGQFALATTDEYVVMPYNMAAHVDGRSSIGRLGLQVHITAGFIDPGFCGRITLELHNVSSREIVLHSGDRICQLVVYRMTSASRDPYSGKYKGQTVAKPSYGG